MAGRVPLAPVAAAAAAMACVVAVSNVAVQYPFSPLGLGDVLTWGAFTYPFAFMVNDVTNRVAGPRVDRRAICAGFAVGVAMSVFLATPRIAAASGTAFLVGQLLDLSVFSRLRRMAWWRAPLAGSLAGSAVDTAIFFTLAFAGEELPWITWALGDFTVKLLFAVISLLPYSLLVGWLLGRVRAA